MFSKPEKKHQWLDKLTGTWTVESECQMEPDKPYQKSKRQTSCRSLGGLWIVMESEGEDPECGKWSSVMTLGYNPKKKRYIGTFVASVMVHLWLYEGSIDKSGGKLILDTEGPRCDQDGLANYQDIFEIIDDDSWILSSQILEENGKWRSFMSAYHQRRK